MNKCDNMSAQNETTQSIGVDGMPNRPKTITLNSNSNTPLLNLISPNAYIVKYWNSSSD